MIATTLARCWDGVAKDAEVLHKGPMPGAAFAGGVSSSVVLQSLVGRADSFLCELLPTTCHSETTGRPGFLLGLWLAFEWPVFLSVCLDVRNIA